MVDGGKMEVEAIAKKEEVRGSFFFKKRKNAQKNWRNKMKHVKNSSRTPPVTLKTTDTDQGRRCMP